MIPAMVVVKRGGRHPAQDPGELIFSYKEGRRLQISSAIHAIRHPFKVPVAPGVALDRFVYSFIIACDTITLVDTGVAGCEETIFDYIRTIGRDPAEISLILLTHSHPDHIGAAKAIRDATGCTVMAHSAERRWIEDTDLQNRERPVPGFSTLVGGPVPLDHELVDGDTIDPDGSGHYDLEVIHTPGHSPGSISLFLKGEGALFSGDAVPVAGDLPVYDDARKSVRSLQRLKRTRNIRILLSAWDEPRSGKAVYDRMDQAASYLEMIHKAVIQASETGTSDIIEFTKRTAALLGLPPQAANPLLARTFAATMKVRDLNDLSAEEKSM
ncbi:MBL fold metallo-hydrolase [Methanoregula sp.]|uniref:MBL fold metallo-hydrolase n=1 Tax=Methanoregula sp. TaxID=2052170 RepID=UPI002600704E|nr:MBL fold metallo-hydrolase [Methanoregula sp.]